VEDIFVIPEMTRKAKLRAMIRFYAPLLLLLGIFVISSITVLQYSPRKDSIDAHETGYAYYPLIMAFETRHLLHDFINGDISEQFFTKWISTWRNFQQEYIKYNMKGYFPGMFLYYFVIFFFTGKSVLATKIMYCVMHALAIALVYRICFYMENDSNHQMIAAFLAGFLMMNHPLYFSNSVHTEIPEEVVSLFVSMIVLYYFFRKVMQGGSRHIIVLSLLCVFATAIKISVGLFWVVCFVCCCFFLFWRTFLRFIWWMILFGAVYCLGIFLLLKITPIRQQIIFWLFEKNIFDQFSFSKNIWLNVLKMLSLAIREDVPKKILHILYLKYSTGLFQIILFIPLLLLSVINRNKKIAMLWVIFLLSIIGCSMAYFRTYNAIIDFFYPIFPVAIIIISLGYSRLVQMIKLQKKWAFGAVIVLTILVAYAGILPRAYISGLLEADRPEYHRLLSLMKNNIEIKDTAFFISAPDVYRFSSKNLLYWYLIDDRNFDYLRRAEKRIIIFDETEGAKIGYALAKVQQDVLHSDCKELAIMACPEKINSSGYPIGDLLARDFQKAGWRSKVKVFFEKPKEYYYLSILNESGAKKISPLRLYFFNQSMKI